MSPPGVTGGGVAPAHTATDRPHWPGNRRGGPSLDRPRGTVIDDRTAHGQQEPDASGAPRPKGTRRRRPDIDPVLGLVTRHRAGSAREHGRFELPSGAFVLAPGVASLGAMTVREAGDRVVADGERQAALGNVAGLTVEKFSPAVLRFAGYAAAAGVATLADVDGDLCWRWCTAKGETGFRFGQDRRVEPNSPKTFRAGKAILRTFFVTCQALGLDDRDPSLTVTLPPLPVYRLFRPLTEQEAERVRKASHFRVGETRFPATVGLALSGVSTAETAVRVRDCYPQAERVWAHGGGARTAPAGSHSTRGPRARSRRTSRTSPARPRPQTCPTPCSSTTRGRPTTAPSAARPPSACRSGRSCGSPASATRPGSGPPRSWSTPPCGCSPGPTASRRSRPPSGWRRSTRPPN